MSFIKNTVQVLYLYYLKLTGVSLQSDNIKIHPSCSIKPGIFNGKKGEVKIAADADLQNGVIIKGYGGRVSIGQNVFLGEYVIVYGHGGVTIGPNTLIAAHTCILSSNHTIPSKSELIRSKPDTLLPVNIGADVWIGAGCKILGGVTIGDGCVVGAGAVVNKDLPRYSISIGVPAKVIKYRG
jgi:acetyltransferase-like isoleucine patch superfamily enzyme